MLIYTIVVASIIVLSSVGLLRVLHKHNLFSLRIFIAISGSSAVVSVLFPVVYNALMGAGSSMSETLGVTLAFVVTIILHVVLIFVFSITVAWLVPEQDMQMFAEALKEQPQLETNANLSIGNAEVQKDISNILSYQKDSPETGAETMLEDLFNKMNAEEGKINIEKPVDSQPNTDKMGIEMFFDEKMETDGESVENSIIEDSKIDGENIIVQEFEIDSKNAEYEEETKETIQSDSYMDDIPNEEQDSEDYVDKAFRLKSDGDYEGAILQYMYALDKIPDRSVVFWIILDICVLYKELGQTDLALEILRSYADTYGDVMDESVRHEIEKNLSYI